MYTTLYQPLSILLVDADVTQRRIATDILTLMGHSVLSAGSVDEAQALLRSNPASILMVDSQLMDESAVDLAKNMVGKNSSNSIIVTAENADSLSLTLPLEFSLLAKPFHYATMHHALQDCRSLKTPARASNDWRYAARSQSESFEEKLLAFRPYFYDAAEAA